MTRARPSLLIPPLFPVRCCLCCVFIIFILVSAASAKQYPSDFHSLIPPTVIDSPAVETEEFSFTSGGDSMPHATSLVIRNIIFKQSVLSAYRPEMVQTQSWRDFHVTFDNCTFESFFWMDNIYANGSRSGISVINCNFTGASLSAVERAATTELARFSYWGFNNGSIEFRNNTFSAPDAVFAANSRWLLMHSNGGNDNKLSRTATAQVVDRIVFTDNRIISPVRPLFAFVRISWINEAEHTTLIVSNVINVSGNHFWVTQPDTDDMQPIDGGQRCYGIHLSLGHSAGTGVYYFLQLTGDVVVDNNTFVLSTPDATGRKLGTTYSDWTGVEVTGVMVFEHVRNTTDGSPPVVRVHPHPPLISLCGNRLTGLDGGWGTAARAVHVDASHVSLGGGTVRMSWNFVRSNAHDVVTAKMSIWDLVLVGALIFENNRAEAEKYHYVHTVQSNCYHVQGIGSPVSDSDGTMPSPLPPRTATVRCAGNSLLAHALPPPANPFFSRATGPADFGLPQAECVALSDGAEANATHRALIIRERKHGFVFFKEVRVERNEAHASRCMKGSSAIYTSTKFFNVDTVVASKNLARIDCRLFENELARYSPNFDTDANLNALSPWGVRIGSGFYECPEVRLVDNDVLIRLTVAAGVSGVVVASNIGGNDPDIPGLRNSNFYIERNTVLILRELNAYTDRTCSGGTMIVNSPATGWFTVFVFNNNFTVLSKQTCPAAGCAGFTVVLMKPVERLARFEATDNYVFIESQRGGVSGIGITAFSEEFEQIGVSSIRLHAFPAAVTYMCVTRNTMYLGDTDGIVFSGVGTAGLITFSLPDPSVIAALPLSRAGVADTFVGLLFENNVLSVPTYASNKLQVLSASVFAISCPLGFLYTATLPVPIPIRCWAKATRVLMSGATSAIILRGNVISANAALRHMLGVSAALAVDTLLIQDTVFLSDQSVGAAQTKQPGVSIPRGELSVFVFIAMSSDMGPQSIRLITLRNVAINATTRCAWNPDMGGDVATKLLTDPTYVVTAQMNEASRRVGILLLDSIGDVPPRIVVSNVTAWIRCLDEGQRVAAFRFYPRGADSVVMHDSTISFIAGPPSMRWQDLYRQVHDGNSNAVSDGGTGASDVTQRLAVDFIAVAKPKPQPIPVMNLNVTSSRIESVGNKEQDVLVSNHDATSRRWPTQGEIRGSLYCASWNSNYITSYRDAVMRKSVPGSDFAIRACPFAGLPSRTKTRSALTASESDVADTRTHRDTGTRTKSLDFVPADLGISAGAIERLEFASALTSAVATIAGNSPSALLASTRGLLLLRLASCKLSAQTRHPDVAASLQRNVTRALLMSSLEFPRSLTPGLRVGDAVGAEYRGAIVSCVIIIFLMVVFLFYGASLNKAKWIQTIIESQHRGPDGGGFRVLPLETHLIGSKLLRSRIDELRRLQHIQYEATRKHHSRSVMMIETNKSNVQTAEKGAAAAAAARVVPVFEEDKERRRILDITHEQLLDEANATPLYKFLAIDKLFLKVLVLFLPKLAENCGVIAGAAMSGADVFLGVAPLVIICVFVASCGVVIYCALNSDADKTDSAIKKREEKEKAQAKLLKKRLERKRRATKQQQQQQEEERPELEQSLRGEEGESDDDGGAEHAPTLSAVCEDDCADDPEAATLRRNKFFDENDHEDPQDGLLGKHTKWSRYHPLNRSRTPTNRQQDDDNNDGGEDDHCAGASRSQSAVSSANSSKSKNLKQNAMFESSPRPRGKPGQDAVEFDKAQQRSSCLNSCSFSSSRSPSSASARRDQRYDDDDSDDNESESSASRSPARLKPTRPEPLFFTEESVIYYPLGSTAFQQKLHAVLSHWTSRFCFIGGSTFRDYNVNLFGRGLPIATPSVFTNFSYSFSSFKGPVKLHLTSDNNNNKRKRNYKKNSKKRISSADEDDGYDDDDDSATRRFRSAQEELEEVSATFTYENTVWNRLQTTFLYISILSTVIAAAITGSSQVDSTQCLGSFVACFLLSGVTAVLALCLRPYTIPMRNICLISIECCSCLAATIFLVIMLRDQSTVSSAKESIATAQILSTLPASIFGPLLTAVSVARFVMVRMARAKVITLSMLRQHINYELDEVEQHLKHGGGKNKKRRAEAAPPVEAAEQSCWQRWCGSGGDSAWDFDF